MAQSEHLLQQLIDIGIQVSSESDTTKLLEQILVGAKTMTNADAGTIYSVTNSIASQPSLKFEMVLNDSLNLKLGGTTGQPITFANIPLTVDGTPNLTALVALAANRNQVVNIDDAYCVTRYDMTGARNMDSATGYHTQSVLTVPMTNHEGELSGVMQLLNAQDAQGQVIPFSSQAEELIRTLASLAAVSISNRQLIDGMSDLLESITHLMAKAIDEKSPFTAGHCRRVPELTMMLADAAIAIDHGPLADFTMDEADRHQLSIAGWLHDCGKIATPEAVLDKATKLQTIFDRIELVHCKIEIAKRDIQLHHQQQLLDAYQQDNQAEIKRLQQQQQLVTQQLSQIEQQRQFLVKCNIGGEFMPPAQQQRVVEIANSYQIEINGQTQPLLSDDEIYNLQIAKGTLTKEERQVINNHINVTIDMLESLPFPKHLAKVPEYAGGHHEKMDGTGYPRGLTREQMSVQARMMAIADIFEALTASDRPYKKAKSLTECLQIMGKMKLEQHIDPDIFDIFIERKVYLTFAEKFLKPEQIDHVDHSQIPSYKGNKLTIVPQKVNKTV